MFENLTWQPDRMLLDDLVFRLEHFKADNWDLGEQCFKFYKTDGLVREYAEFLKNRPDFKPERVLELGIWDGGSIAFWFELFHPKKHVAIDLKQRQDSPYFERYVESRGLRENIRTYWNVDQADRPAISGICAREFDGALDLVIDDASHLYGPTKASFETLFPLLRPGGLYVIEDWAWGHWADYQRPDHPWAKEIPLTQLVIELIECIGGPAAPIRRLTVSHGFVVAERAWHSRGELGDFKLDNYISRRPATSPA